jgi:hypothetical protein
MQSSRPENLAVLCVSPQALCIKKMKTLITILTLFWASISFASPIDCKVTDESTVIVTMEIPHPNHVLAYRPDGEIVWLQTGPEYIHKQLPNFSELKTWIITSESKGTVWVNGKATIQPIIKGKGRYHLYIAENIETEPENTYFIECYFVIGDKW